MKLAEHGKRFSVGFAFILTGLFLLVSFMWLVQAISEISGISELDALMIGLLLLLAVWIAWIIGDIFIDYMKDE